MKFQNYFFVLLFLLTGIVSNAQCKNCNDPSNVITQNSNGDFATSSAQAYYWEICEGNATIVGSNTSQTVSVNCSRGTFKIKVTRFINGDCIEACETYTCDDNCNYWVAILNVDIDGSQSGSGDTIYLLANGNYPQGTFYSWLITYENGSTQNYEASPQNPRPISASFDMRVSEARVTASYQNCSETVTQLFDCALPDIDENGNLSPECSNLEGGFSRKNNVVKVYPNPAKNGQSINISGLDNYEVEKIDIVDMSGNVVLTEIKKLNSVELGSLKTGIYFIKISTKQGIIQKKVIVN